MFQVDAIVDATKKLRPSGDSAPKFFV